MGDVSVPCGSCGKPVRGGDDFCEACGAPVDDELKRAYRERLAMGFIWVWSKTAVLPAIPAPS
jgi:predicted nucleic acid-binding Zn ribbon protein